MGFYCKYITKNGKKRRRICRGCKWFQKVCWNNKKGWACTY